MTKQTNENTLLDKPLTHANAEDYTGSDRGLTSMIDEDDDVDDEDDLDEDDLDVDEIDVVEGDEESVEVVPDDDELDGDISLDDEEDEEDDEL